MGEIHAERRMPETPTGPLMLDAVADQLLDEATGMASGRAARTLTPGAHVPLKQALVALRSGVTLSEHELNGPATVLVLRGAMTIDPGGEALEVEAGQWTVVPTARHGAHAREDTVALLTVAPTTTR